MSSPGKRTRTRTTIVGPGSVLRLPSAKIAVVILAVVIFLAVFGSLLAPQNPLSINANALYQGPSLHHLLGTDYLGRDVLSRLMAGTRLSVLTAFEAVAIGLVIGAPLGVATVFLGKWFDFAANRVADALMTLPYIFFAWPSPQRSATGWSRPCARSASCSGLGSSASPGRPRLSSPAPSTWRQPSCSAPRSCMSSACTWCARCCRPWR